MKCLLIVVILAITNFAQDFYTGQTFYIGDTIRLNWSVGDYIESTNDTFYTKVEISKNNMLDWDEVATTKDTFYNWYVSGNISDSCFFRFYPTEFAIDTVFSQLFRILSYDPTIFSVGIDSGLVFPGNHLTIIDSVKISEVKQTILMQSESVLKCRGTDPLMPSRSKLPVVFYYGAQSYTYNMLLITTISTNAAVDSAFVRNGFYLKKKVATNYDSVKIDGIKGVTIGQDGTYYEFQPPSTIMAGNTKHPIVLYYSGGSYSFSLKFMKSSVFNSILNIGVGF